ncbi:MAG: FtsX-like permease family protein [Treponema sp.]|jgi:putative ABC transport system permease protein|nr:FtsX-like permease family protein [Treponema sp.]
MFFFLALRNITRNLKDRVIIVLLIAVITFIFFIGNSVFDSANRNIRSIFIDSLTGDIVLQKTCNYTLNLFGANAPVINDSFVIPVLPVYDIALEIAGEEPGIERITSQVSGNAVLELLDVRETALLAGVDASSYFSLFPGIILEQGRFLTDGEYGAMITAERAQRIEERSGQRVQTGMPLLLTSVSRIGFKFREVPLVGIFSYQNPGQIMNEIVITDPQTVRVLNSIQVAGAWETQGSIDFWNEDFDDIFSNSAFAFDSEAEEAEFSIDMLHNFLLESNTDTNIAQTGGDWNFIILRLKKGFSSASVIRALNSKLQPYGLTAVNWRIASGSSSVLLLLVMILFNLGVFLICVGGIIAVINILFISVFKRVREIGTLRAIGASDIDIRSLIYTENLLAGLIAGVAGVLGGFIFIQLVNSLGLNINNDLLASILNGKILQVDLKGYIAIYSFLIAVVLGLASTIYPIEIAVRIEPVVAVQRG